MLLKCDSLWNCFCIWGILIIFHTVDYFPLMQHQQKWCYNLITLVDYFGWLVERRWIKTFILKSVRIYKPAGEQIMITCGSKWGSITGMRTHTVLRDVIAHTQHAEDKLKSDCRSGQHMAAFLDMEYVRVLHWKLSAALTELVEEKVFTRPLSCRSYCDGDSFNIWHHGRVKHSRC